MTTTEILIAKRQELFALRDGKAQAGYIVDRLRRDMKEKAERNINRFVAVSEEIKALNRLQNLLAEVEKEVRVLADKEALEKAAEEAPYPVGTKMVLWKSYTGGYGKPYRFKASDERGVVEVVTSATVHPENIGHYAQASVGCFIIRLLRKNGLPGKQYVGCPKNPSSGFLWRPEGVDLE